MILWLLAIGLISILGQVVLLRELNVAFFGSELIYILAIGCWLLWTATGAAIGRRAFQPARTHVQWLLLICSLVVPLSVVLVRGSRQLLGAVPGAYLPFPTQLLTMALSLLPVGFVLGLLFQWAAKDYLARGRTLAAAYAIECAGGVLGGILATLFLKWGVSNFTAALLCGFCALVVACSTRHSGRSRGLALAAIVGLGLLIAALAASERLDRGMTAWEHPQLRATRDTPYGRVTVTELAGQIAVFQNGALAYESQGTAAEEFVHLAALQTATPESVLVLGGGVEGLVAELLTHRPRAVTYVELNPAQLDLLRQHLPPEVTGAMQDPAVQVVHADPRRYLRDGPLNDLILVGMPEPASGQTNRFYTREFFAQCAARLAPGGVLAFRMRSAENLWTPQLLRRTASIHHALAEVFDQIVILPGVTNLVFASSDSLITDPAVLGQRLLSRGIEGRLITPAYIEYLYTNDRFAEIARLLDEAQAPLNTDVRPICYQYTMLIWLSKFYPVLAVMDLPDLGRSVWLRSVWTWLALAAGLGLLWFGRRRLSTRRLLLAAGAGFLGMLLESILILGYQVRSGVLYQDLGLLLTTFMAGLALGAWVLDRRARWSVPDTRDRLGRGFGLALWLGFAALSLFIAWQLRLDAGGYLIGTTLSLLASGFLVAAVFGYASLQGRPDQRSLVSPLYAADLLGGCFASVLAGLLFIPVIGLAGSALLAAVLAAAGLLLV